MIDIHAHLLPDVDDGAQTIEESIALAKQAVLDGITQMVLTPHYNQRFINHKDDVITAVEQLQRLYDSQDIPLRVMPSQEIRLTKTLVDDILYGDDYLSLDDTGKYYLIEFPTKTIPDDALSILEELVSQGITPIIAHPERNHVFAKNLKKLRQFIELGCLAQVTSHSYLGTYGEKLRHVSHEMIKQNLVHVIATDAHHSVKRPVILNAAYQQLEKEFNRDTATYFQKNAEDIVLGKDINRRPPTKSNWLGDVLNKYFKK
ncbi:hypothetical protein KG089_03205 [Carnobacteriaceae bacterium zg-ZUI252]|nr:hypothetical protein [Carnobacteriaceae bacterium zg-ZUI252]MBS4770047.1 hypothetical protein [Carnobacteriaceae bacterium zg-ZUI240]